MVHCSAPPFPSKGPRKGGVVMIKWVTWTLGEAEHMLTEEAAAVRQGREGLDG